MYICVYFFDTNPVTLAKTETGEKKGILLTAKGSGTFGGKASECNTLLYKTGQQK
jgi:hypothetical protein